MVTLRTATIADRAAADALLSECSLPALDEGAQFGGQYVLAVQDESGALAGMAGVEVRGGDALLRSVAVSAHSRGAGLGAELVRDRIAWARFEGLRNVYLLTTDAAGYFVRYGFVTVARDDAPAAIAESHLWNTVCPASSTAMKLALASGS